VTTRTVNPLALHLSDVSSTTHIHPLSRWFTASAANLACPNAPLSWICARRLEDEESLSSSAKQSISTKRHNAALSRRAVFSASSLEVLCCFDTSAGVRAVQVGNTKNISLAAQRRGEATADLALASLDGSGRVGETLGDCGGGGEAQESGEGEDGELHFGGLVGWVGLVVVV